MSLKTFHLIRAYPRIISFLSRNLSLFSAYFAGETDNNNAKIPVDGLTLRDFISHSSSNDPARRLQISSDIPSYIDPSVVQGWNRKVYFDVYGCQMNVNDTEIVWAILESAGFSKTADISEADVILMMTCAIRENAEKKIWNKLLHYKHLKNKKNAHERSVQIGILGCMAERLKDKLLEKEACIDLVCGPDSYKDLPRLLALTSSHQKAVNVLLSLEETYADIVPVRLNQDSVTAFVSIMRGCDNMCSYCIVPFTRGRERSRPLESIIREVVALSEQGVKEITLLGQNVNSYRDVSSIASRANGDETILVPGFSTVYKNKKGGIRFAQLLDEVACAVPNVRIRFTSPHPKDFPMQVLDTMAKHPNICKSIHLPAQSGSDTVLERMRRGYTCDAYKQLVNNIRSILPSVTLSSDFICGFCSETEDDFQRTLDLIDDIKYNVAYLFAYSMREKTTAHRRYKDDVPNEIKQERLLRMIKHFRRGAEIANTHFLNSTQTVLVEGFSKRSADYFQGRTDGNIKVIFPMSSVPEFCSYQSNRTIRKGDYVDVKITKSNSQVLKGEAIQLTALSNTNSNLTNKHTMEFSQ